MKKWFSYIRIFLLLLATVLPSAAALAASGEMTVQNSNVTVALNIPEGVTETITSLRFQMFVSVNTGSVVDKPAFRFADSIVSSVKDAEVTEQDGGYLVDIILSGKETQNIFGGSDRAVIGTLALQPAQGDFQALVEILGEAADGSRQPVVYYVDGGGNSVLAIPLKNTAPVTVTGGEQTPGGSGGSGGSPAGPGGSSSTQTPEPSASPEATSSPLPSPGETEEPGSSAEPGATASPGATSSPSPSGGFARTKKPKLGARAKNVSGGITLTWGKISGADGYMIYQLDKKTGKYKRVKTISGQTATSYTKKFACGGTYSFKIRAFATDENGGRIYGSYSSAVRIKAAPPKVKGLKARARGSKVDLSWKKAAGAEGYQIYSSSKKSGKYTLVKTIQKGSKKKCSVKRRGGKKCYYKIRAYVTGNDKKRVYGGYSAKVRA